MQLHVWHMNGFDVFLHVLVDFVIMNVSNTSVWILDSILICRLLNGLLCLNLITKLDLVIEIVYELILVFEFTVVFHWFNV